MIFLYFLDLLEYTGMCNLAVKSGNTGQEGKQFIFSKSADFDRFNFSFLGQEIFNESKKNGTQAFAI